MFFFSNKILVRESGLLEGFCDYHCHLLPGVDDGVKEMEDTLHILEDWEMAGVKEVWMTPHIMEDIPNTQEELERVFEQVKECYSGVVKLHLAAEHMMDGMFVRKLDRDGERMMTLFDDYLLVETSYYTPPMNMEAIIDRIKKLGYEPVLAHPERYQYMNMKDYRRWKEQGLLLQLNVPSLVGAYSPDVQRKAEWLLKENMYDFCGTDTHSIDQVGLFMNSLISKKMVKKVKGIIKV